MDSPEKLRKLAAELRKLAAEIDSGESNELDPEKVRDFLIFYGGSNYGY